MVRRVSKRLPPSDVARAVLVSALLAAAGCAGTAATGGGAGVATEAEWRELREARPEPLPDAPRLTVAEVRFLGSFEWPEEVRLDAGLGVSELVAANLLRRRDVHFVERRRFDAAVTAVRRGEPSPPDRPPPGVSPGAELDLIVVWVPTTAERANLEIRLTRLETGDVDGTSRIAIEKDADPVAVARAIVAGAVDLLGELDRLPEWNPPFDAENTTGQSRVSTEALRHFLRGLAAEERWDWEGARRGYQQAMAADLSFHEARVALARTARLRLGGTLGES